MPTNKRYILLNNFIGEPKESDFELVTEEVLPLEKGEVLCEAMYISIDLCIRMLDEEIAEGKTIPGTQIAKVVESADDQFPVGGLVFGAFGWQLYTVCRPESPHATLDRLTPQLLDLGHFPASLALGVLGTPGNVAYCGLLELCRPDEGDVVAVSSVTGAVGSIVAQIAKIKGCVVVGIVGSAEEADWLRDIGADSVINYRATSSLATALKEAAPHGINCYFDNVGGEISSVVMSQMNMNGRVACCSPITLYNYDNNQSAPSIQPYITEKQLKVEGMMASRWRERSHESYRVLSKWLDEEKLKYRETLFEGFEKLPQALISLLKGCCIGTVIIRA